jgi:hypothetical protein
MTMPSPTLPLNETLDFTIANAASVSDQLNISNRVPTGIFMPAAWTAAAVTLRTSLDNATWYDVYTVDGTEFSVAGTAGVFIPINPGNMLGIGMWLQVRSGLAAAPVNQGAERVLKLRLGRPDAR